MAYNSELTPRAKELRKNATKQENHLWYDYLREFRPRFTRQRIFGNYILDFYCGKAKLAIEIDGSQHYETKSLEYDEARTKYLESSGIRVIRFTNAEINTNFDGVCDTIKRIVTEALDGNPRPCGAPPSNEGG